MTMPVGAPSAGIAPPPPFGEQGPLCHIPLFARLREPDQQTLMSAMRLQRVEPNQTIVWCGDRGDSCYLVSTGEVAVSAPNHDGQHVHIDTIGPGGFFGEVSLLDGGPRTATVRATKPTELYVLARADFHGFIRTNTDAALHILTIMGERQRAMNEALKGMKNPNIAFDAMMRLSWWQRVSDAIAGVAASKWFTMLHIAWFGTWIGLNLLATLGALPARLAFDPFPFGLLTMVVSLEAIFLSIFVMVSQNRQSEKDRVRTDLDYQVNVKAQTQINSLGEQLDRIEKRLNERRDEG